MAASSAIRSFKDLNVWKMAMDLAESCYKCTPRFPMRDGRIAIDNNRVENAIRPTAVGKKNWLFIGEAEAGHRGAILYTLVESCRRRDIDPQAYLRDVLTRLPKMTTSQIPDVIPEAWSKARMRVHAPQAAA